MNISKQQFQYWTKLKYLLSGAGIWVALQIRFPPEYKDINFYSVNIPVLLLLIATIGWCWLIIKIDEKLGRDVQ